jgi:hypothetical protein
MFSAHTPGRIVRIENPPDRLKGFFWNGRAAGMSSCLTEFIRDHALDFIDFVETLKNIINKISLGEMILGFFSSFRSGFLVLGNQVAYYGVLGRSPWRCKLISLESLF